MREKHKGLTARSIGGRMLIALVNRGGIMSRDTFQQLASVGAKNIYRFRDSVDQPLQDQGFVELRGGMYVATQKGKDFAAEQALLEAHTEVEKYVGVPAAPREPSPERPLNVAKHMGIMPRREGAMDYLAFPSLMAGERVPYGVKAAGTSN